MHIDMTSVHVTIFFILKNKSCYSFVIMNACGGYCTAEGAMYVKKKILNIPHIYVASRHVLV